MMMFRNNIIIGITNIVEIAITHRPTKIYDLKFFFKFLKKLGPEINPTEPMKNIKPIFSSIFNPFEDISIESPFFIFCDIVDLIWEEKIAPYINAIINTPDEPKLIPFIVILPNKNPKKMQTNVENIKKDIPFIMITPEKIFIFYKIENIN